MNGKQMEHAIQEAIEQVQEEGWKNVQPEHLILAGLGYLAGEVRESSHLRVKVDGKAWLSVALVAGSFVGAALRTLI